LISIEAGAKDAETYDLIQDIPDQIEGFQHGGLLRVLLRKIPCGEKTKTELQLVEIAAFGKARAIRLSDA